MIADSWMSDELLVVDPTASSCSGEYASYLIRNDHIVRLSWIERYTIGVGANNATDSFAAAPHSERKKKHHVNHHSAGIGRLEHVHSAPPYRYWMLKYGADNILVVWLSSAPFTNCRS